MKSRQGLKNMKYLLILVLFNLLFGDAYYYDTSKYFFAKLDESDSTFTIILDGSFFERITRNPYKKGDYVENPTTKFEIAFTKNFYANPNVFSLHQINNTYNYKIKCKSSTMEHHTSLKIGSPFVIIAISNDGSGRRIQIKIESFYYYSYFSELGFTKSYLIAKSNKIEDIIGFEKNYHVAIYQGHNDNDIEPPLLIDTNIPESVKMKMDSISNSKVEYNNKIKEEFKNSRNAERTIRQLSYKTEIQPFETTTSQNIREKRYIISTYRFGKGNQGKILLLNKEDQFLNSLTQYSKGIFAKCEGIVRTKDYDLIIIYNATGDYTGGLSLLKQDNDGVLKEVMFLGTVFD